MIASVRSPVLRGNLSLNLLQLFRRNDLPTRGTFFIGDMDVVTDVKAGLPRELPTENSYDLQANLG